MPSAATAKSDKPVSTEAADNSPIRQIITILEHKIRNLEKRKSKLTSYRDLQKAGKELNADQKVAVAKYDEVAQTLEFARDLSKQVTAIAISADRDAKKQAKKEAFVRYTSDSKKIREVLLILDCLNQMGNPEARQDFVNGTNGAVRLTLDDLKVLDDLYQEVTPKHDLNEEGQPGFQSHTIKAADHLYAIIDGKPKEVLGTTYAHIKEVVTAVHECGYFEKSAETIVAEVENCNTNVEEEALETPVEEPVDPNVVPTYVTPPVLPVPPAPAVVPAPAYPLRPIPPITLQEVEHAYFSQQYLQRRPISEVIGSQNFYFLQESEIDSPVGTPQPPPILNQPSPPAPIPTQTFTNPHYVQIPGSRVDEAGAMPLPPQPHFPPHPEHAHGGFPAAPPAPAPAPPAAPLPPAAALPHVPQQPMPEHSHSLPEEQLNSTPLNDKNDEEWKENRRSPENDEGNERKTQGQGDGQNRYRRYGRGINRPNGYRGRGAFQNRQNNDGYHSRHSGEYQNRSNKEGYQNRQYNDNYQNRHGKDGYHNRGGNDAYYGNGDTGESHQQNENGRERYDGTQSYQGGYKGRGRGGAGRGVRGAARPGPAGHSGHAANPSSRAHHYNQNRKQENND